MKTKRRRRRRTRTGTTKWNSPIPQMITGQVSLPLYLSVPHRLEAYYAQIASKILILKAIHTGTKAATTAAHNNMSIARVREANPVTR